MPGRVLIIDDLATNRIILKVKLAAAYYDVTQAACVADACHVLDSLSPDLVLLGYRGSADDAASEGLADALRALHQKMREGLDIPVVVLLDDQQAEERVTALSGGAADVFSRPLDERLLLARLRSLMRQHMAGRDLQEHGLTAHPEGFAEQQHGFDLPGQIGVIAQNKGEARKLQSRLAANGRHGVRMMSPEEIMRPGNRQPAGPPRAGKGPDVFVMQLDTDQAEEGRRLLSELRADPETRNCPVIAHLPGTEGALAAQLYDLGAGDIIFHETDPEEMTLRLERQLGEKRHLDFLRNQLQNGLQAAVIDPLTGLYNRRYALSYIDKLTRQPAKPQEIFAVMVADLDHFKQINDRLGHAAGDSVLKHVAHLLKSCLRQEDMLARIGGEEFLIIIPGTSEAQASTIASELCAAISGEPILLAGHKEPIRVTVSIGLALTSTMSRSSDDIIDRADRALYRSKAEGRNTVRVAAQDAA